MTRKKVTTEKFIKKSKKLHGSRFDYTKVHYNRSNEPVLIICSKHGEFLQTPNNHLLGKGCKQCGYEKFHSSRIISAKEAIKRFSIVHNGKYSYDINSYKGSENKLTIICPEHGPFTQNANAHKQGQGCPVCGKQNKNLRLTQEQFEDRCKEVHGDLYKYIEDYINMHSKIKIVCSVHGLFFQTPYSHINNKSGCPSCANNIRSIKSRLTTDEFIKRSNMIHKNKYDYTKTRYMRHEDKVFISCPIHGTFFQIANGHLYGHGCPKCGNIESKAETELFQFVSEMGFQNVEKTRKIIKPLELDIYIPEKRLAIEYCGLHWHSELKGKDRNYHLNKLKKCQEKGIELITIFESDYVFKPNVVKSIISHRLNMPRIRIQARHCTVRQIKNDDYREFMNSNHIQGYVSASIRLGAYHSIYGLISIMSFSKPRFSKKFDYELIRFCNKKNFHVVGIAGKLFSKAKKHLSGSVVSYSDLRYGSGNVYKHLGFSYSHMSSPNYWYFENGHTILESRVKYQKHKLVKEGYDPNLSEWQIMQERGYNRIWDCGNAVWIWNKINQ